VVLLTAPVAVFADTFDYNYTATANGTTFAATYASPTLLTTTTFLSAGSPGLTCTVTNSFSPTCEEVIFAVLSNTIVIDYTQVIFGSPFFPELDDPGSAGLFTVGTHSTTYGTLTITDVPAVAATPEPSSIMLMGTGLLSLAGIARRRFSA
jgi:hypothetical protein